MVRAQEERADLVVDSVGFPPRADLVDPEAEKEDSGFPPEADPPLAEILGALEIFLKAFLGKLWRRLQPNYRSGLTKQYSVTQSVSVSSKIR